MQLSTIPRRPLSTGEVSPLALLATLLAATFLIICAWYCKATLERISQHHEIGYWSFSKPIAGTHSLAHEFTAHSSTLGKFYAFAKREDLQQSRDETIVVELLDAVDLTVLHRLGRTLGRITFLDHGSLGFTANWTVEKGKRYWLRFSLPEAAEDRGLSFIVSPALAGSSDLLWIDSEVQEGMVLNHLILGSQARFPLRLVLVGVLLAGLSVACRKTAGRWPLILLTAGMAMTLSEYAWERSLWNFFGYYWPDGYVDMANRIFGWLSGPSTLGEVVDFLSRERNGCNFLAPLLIAFA